MNLLEDTIETLCMHLTRVCPTDKPFNEITTLDGTTIRVKLGKWLGLIYLDDSVLKIIQIRGVHNSTDKSKSMNSLKEITDYAYNFEVDDVPGKPNHIDIDIVLTRALKLLLTEKFHPTMIYEINPKVYHAQLQAFIREKKLPVNANLLDDNNIYIFGFTGKNRVRLIIDMNDCIILIPIHNRITDASRVNKDLKVSVIVDSSLASFISTYKDLSETGPDIYYLIANTLNLL